MAMRIAQNESPQRVPAPDFLWQAESEDPAHRQRSIGTTESEVESLSSMRGLYVSPPLVRWRKILMFVRLQPCGGFGDVNQRNDTNLVGVAHFDGIIVRCTSSVLRINWVLFQGV